MNKTPSETAAFISKLLPLLAGSKNEIVVCPPAACLFAARGILKDSGIKLGAQDMHFADAGAYTGETSPDALTELGVEYVILGHSERRQNNGETNQIVNKKLLKALEKRIRPIVCVGENLTQREDGITNEVVREQVKLVLKNVNAGYIPDIVIAYEPIWAIGTGLTATTKDANDTIRVIRSLLKELYSEDAASQTRILYGGSMNASNAKNLLSMSDIDGGLIGGASLNVEEFSLIAMS